MKQFYDEGFIRGTTHQITTNELTTKVFYKKFLSKNRPVLVEDGAKKWIAIEKWKDFKYIV